MDKKTCDHCITTMDKMYRQALHSLWMARALRAKDNFKHFGKMFSNCEKTNEKYFLDKYNKWGWAYHKCLQKAKEFE